MPFREKLSFSEDISRVSLNDNPLPRDSRIEALSVIMPIPPAWIRISSMSCPHQLNEQTGTEASPVTQTALVAMKKESTQLMLSKSFIPSSLSRTVPAEIMMIKESSSSVCPFFAILHKCFCFMYKISITFHRITHFRIFCF